MRCVLSVYFVWGACIGITVCVSVTYIFKNIKCFKFKTTQILSPNCKDTCLQIILLVNQIASNNCFSIAKPKLSEMLSRLVPHEGLLLLMALVSKGFCHETNKQISKERRKLKMGNNTTCFRINMLRFCNPGIRNTHLQIFDEIPSHAALLYVSYHCLLKSKPIRRKQATTKPVSRGRHTSNCSLQRLALEDQGWCQFWVASHVACCVLLESWSTTSICEGCVVGEPSYCTSRSVPPKPTNYTGSKGWHVTCTKQDSGDWHSCFNGWTYFLLVLKCHWPQLQICAYPPCQINQYLETFR